MVIPMWAQHKVKSNYEKYSQVRSTSGKTGREVAEEILHANGIYDVDVVKGEGFLTDHYDPNKKKGNHYKSIVMITRNCVVIYD